MNYGFIGCGNMVQSIIKGMVSSRFLSKEDDATIISSKSHITAKNVATLYEKDINICTKKLNSDVVKISEILVLGVKPYALDEILLEIKPFVETKPNLTIVSIVAGVDIDTLYSKLPENTPIIRVMPNINSKVMHSTTGYCKNSFVSNDAEKIVKEMFSVIGNVAYVEESNFNAFTALASSSIAFTYLYMNTLATAGVKAGLTKKQAMDIVCHSLIGCCKMIEETNSHPVQLIDEISSPNGITVEGVSALYQNGFQGDIMVAFHEMMRKFNGEK